MKKCEDPARPTLPRLKIAKVKKDFALTREPQGTPEDGLPMELISQDSIHHAEPYTHLEARTAWMQKDLAIGTALAGGSPSHHLYGATFRCMQNARVVGSGRLPLRCQKAWEAGYCAPESEAGD